MKKKRNYFVLPMTIFEIGFVMLPVLYVVFISFTKRTDSWDICFEFTLENYKNIFNPLFLPALKQSFKIAFISTLFCLILGYPAGLFIANLDKKKQSFFLKANILPFLFNSLMRICGLIILFRSNGVIDTVYRYFFPQNKGLHLLYSPWATICGMVYVLLPFMVYCVYASVSKQNRDSLNAAYIMGAGTFRGFLDVTLPLSAGGLLNGVILCFIPAMGLYIITSLLGGGKIIIISNIIEDQIMKVRNLPFGAALSVFLMLITACMVALAKLLNPVEIRIRRAKREAAK